MTGATTRLAIPIAWLIFWPLALIFGMYLMLDEWWFMRSLRREARRRRSRPERTAKDYAKAALSVLLILAKIIRDVAGLCLLVFVSGMMWATFGYWTLCVLIPIEACIFLYLMENDVIVIRHQILRGAVHFTVVSIAAAGLVGTFVSVLIAILPQ